MQMIVLALLLDVRLAVYTQFTTLVDCAVFELSYSLFYIRH